MHRLLYFSFVFFLLAASCPAQHPALTHAQQVAAHFEPKLLPLETVAALEPLVAAASQKKLVLLGEASHGTSEFYSQRAEISKKLIEKHGFNFIAVEGDWASLYRLNKYVQHRDNAPASAVEAMYGFNRWPEWMWGNTDVAGLIEWLHDYNKGKAPEKMVGFYGMDVYGQWEAMDDLLAYAEIYIPEHYEAIAAKMQCFARFDRDEWMYARSTAQLNYNCKQELEDLVALLADLRESLEEGNKSGYFRAKQNALVVKNAEDYFRLAMQGNNDAWNSRARHMWISVQRLFELYGPESKGIVWAHNTHVGDARATGMGESGMVNIGMLSRMEWGNEEVFITGFGTYTGKVNAGARWGTPMRIMNVPKALSGSLEHAFSQFKHPDFLLIFDDEDRNNPIFQQHIGHRAIGVIYNPRDEAGNYVPSLFTQRYDAFIFIRETTALEPVIGNN